MSYLDFYNLLRMHQKIKSPKLKLIGIYIANYLGFRHYSVRIDPALHCNLECKMCYFSDSEFKKGFTGLLSNDEIKGVAAMLFPKAIQLVVGCGAEPTIHKNFMLLIEEAHRYKVPNISMVTNGLLLTEEQITKMAQLQLKELILSMHGVTQETYENMMTKGEYSKFVNLLQMVKKVRQKYEYPKIRINYTVNTQNMEELDTFFDVYGEYPIDSLQIRPVMNIGGLYSESITEDQKSRYLQIVDKLKKYSKEKNIRFLVNTQDVEYQKENADSELIAALYRYVSPRIGKQIGISWKDNTYKDYLKATQWRKNVLNGIFGIKKVKKDSDRYLKYEIV